MKTTIFILIAVILIAAIAITAISILNTDRIGSNSMHKGVDFAEGEWWSENRIRIMDEQVINLNIEALEPLKGMAIENQEKATDIANIIHEEWGIGNSRPPYVLIAVFHDTMDNVWIFTFGFEEIMPSSSYFVAVCGKNSEIILAWVD